MADVTVLRVEVRDVGEVKEGSLSPSSKQSTSKSLAAGALASKAMTAADKYDNDMRMALKSSVDNGSLFFGRGDSREERFKQRQLAKWMIRKTDNKKVVRPVANSMYRRNISAPTYGQITTGVSAAVTLAAKGYQLYSNYQKAGYEMSGAAHAASVQDRKGQLAQSTAEIGLAMMINPLLAAPMIAMKAYQLAQTNRREIFEIQKNQMTSNILQRNLVKTVAERRF